jgi:hypothetical protein
MGKIDELDTQKVHSLSDIREKLNEVIEVVNSLEYVGEEIPIFEKIADGESLIISRGEDGLLVASNIGSKVTLSRVKERKRDLWEMNDD